MWASFKGNASVAINIWDDPLIIDSGRCVFIYHAGIGQKMRSFWLSEDNRSWHEIFPALGGLCSITLQGHERGGHNGDIYVSVIMSRQGISLDGNFRRFETCKKLFPQVLKNLFFTQARLSHGIDVSVCLFVCPPPIIHIHPWLIFIHKAHP